MRTLSGWFAEKNVLYEKFKVLQLDIDLAGRMMPLHPQLNGVRSMDDVTWPRIRLRYTLESNGVTSGAEESIADMHYLARTRGHSSSDRFVHEKQMLDEWFRIRFVEHRPAR